MGKRLKYSFYWVLLLILFAFLTEGLYLFIKFGLINNFPLPVGVYKWYGMLFDMERLVVYSIIIMSAIITDLVVFPYQFVTKDIRKKGWIGVSVLSLLMIFYVLHKVFDQNNCIMIHNADPSANLVLSSIEKSLPIGAFLISVKWKYAMNLNHQK